MTTDEERMAAKLMGEWQCPKCNMVLTGPDAGPDKSHGWISVRNGPKPDGKGFPFVYCVDAVEEDVNEYRAAKAELARRQKAADEYEAAQRAERAKQSDPAPSDETLDDEENSG